MQARPEFEEEQKRLRVKLGWFKKTAIYVVKESAKRQQEALKGISDSRDEQCWAARRHFAKTGWGLPSPLGLVHLARPEGAVAQLS